ncbi:MAG: glycosyltransferase [Patescibacteria group bacterium]
MPSTSPRVSVVMSVHDGQAYLREAIDSILMQTEKDLELIIIDDASTDGTVEIIRSYVDPRIRFLQNEKQAGLAASVNRGIREARAPYIARMDADDISQPDRLERQLAFLATHPEVSVVGSRATMVDEHGKHVRDYRVPLTHGGIRWRALFANPLVHPSIMARTDVLRANPYDESYPNSQDYALWSTLLFEKDIRFANLPEKLLHYRLHPGSTTAKRDDAKKRISVTTSLANIARELTLEAPEEVAYAHFRSNEHITWHDARCVDQLINRLCQMFLQTEKLTLDERKEVQSLARANRISIVKHLLKQALRP